MPRPPWGWAVWSAWYGALFVGTEIAHLSSRRTIVAVAAALPLAAYGAWMARTAPR